MLSWYLVRTYVHEESRNPYHETSQCGLSIHLTELDSSLNLRESIKMSETLHTSLHSHTQYITY